MEAENEGNAPVLHFNAARLVELESERNKYLKEEIELGNKAQQIFALFKTKTNKRFVYVLLAVAFSLAIAVWLEELPFALFFVIWSLHCFVSHLWLSMLGASRKLYWLNCQLKTLIAKQSIWARMAEYELGRLNFNDNVEEIFEGGPLISLRSFVARGPTIELEEIRREMKSFVWKKGFHCFLLLLFVASLVILFGVIHY